MADGSQENLLLRLIPEDPDPTHNELIPRAPEDGGLLSVAPADPDVYGDTDRPVIDHYADTFNLRKKIPQPGFAPGFGPTPFEFAQARETLFRLAITTPGAAGPVFTSWVSALYREWIAGSLGEPTSAAAHDLVRLLAHRARGPLGHHSVQICISTRTVRTNSFTRTFFFIPSPSVRVVLGVPITSVTYRVFVHDQASDTFTETAGRPVVTVSGSVRFEVRAAIAGTGWTPVGDTEQSNLLYVIAFLSNGTGRMSRSTNGGTTWSDFGQFSNNIAFGGTADFMFTEQLWEFDFFPRIFAVFETFTGNIAMLSGDIFDASAGAFFTTTPVANAQLALPGSPGTLCGKRGVWGRGATSTNDAHAATGLWSAFAWYRSGTFEYGLHIEGDGSVPDTDITWGPAAAVTYPTGTAIAAGRVFCAFYTPSTNSGEFRVVRLGDGQDDTSGGSIAWPFTVPGGFTYIGGLDATDNTLLMPYVRDIGGGTIEYGLAVGEIDQASQPIDSALKISWTFVPTDPGDLSGWIPRRVSRFSQAFVGFDPFASLSDDAQLFISRVSGEAAFWFETAMKQLRVTVFPLSSFPMGGVQVFLGDEADRASPDDGRFLFEYDVRPIADVNEHVLVRAEALDSDGLIYHTAEIRAYLEPEVTNAVNDWPCFEYTTMIEDMSGDADNVLTAGLWPVAVTDVIGSGDFFIPSIDDPIENASYPFDEDDLIIDAFEARAGNGTSPRHQFYCVTWARNLRTAVYRAGGDWVTGVVGVRALEITLEINQARVIVANSIDNAGGTLTQLASTFTVEVALINTDTGAILHSLGTRDFVITAGGFGINGTDPTVVGGSVSYMGALPSSWQVGVLCYLSGSFATYPGGPPNAEINRRIFYRIDSMTLSIQPDGNVALP